MIDAEVYLAQLQRRDLTAKALTPDPNIAPDIDVNELGDLPAIYWSVIGTGQSANADGLWLYTLFGNVLGEGMDQAKAIARAWYDVVHAWGDDPSATVLTIEGAPVCVAFVEDLDLPSRQAQPDVRARGVVQYSGAFTLGLRG